MVQFYGAISKVDAEQRMVWGYASTEAVDSDGEIIKRSAIEVALEDYMKFANIREMHQPSAVGLTKEATVDDKGLYIGVKVTDDRAWGKVMDTTYKGFSIGGKVLARDPVSRKTITKIGLYEISLVDRPANPESTFDVWKIADSNKEPEMTLDDLDKAEALAKGTPLAEVEALAKAEADKAAADALVKAEADKAAADKYGADKLAADKFIADRVAKGDKVAEATSAMDPEARIEWVAKTTAELDDPVAKAKAAVAELKAVVDAHTAPVVDLSKFDAAMAALVALGDVGAPVVELFKAAKAEADEGAGAALKGVVPEADLTKALSVGEDLTKALAVRDAAFAELTATVATLTKSLSDFGLQARPAKTAGPGVAALYVVEKGEDASGSGRASAAADADTARIAADSESVAKYLASLPEEERVFQIMKAAQATPIKLNR